jgi:hypothetical protein
MPEGMDGNKTGDREWEASSVVIFTIHGISFSGLNTVTSPTLLYHHSRMVDTLPLGQTAHFDFMLNQKPCRKSDNAASAAGG